MLKKTLAAMIASAFALTLSVPLAVACSDHADKKDKQGEIAKDEKAPADKEQKAKKVARADKKKAKKDKAPQK